MLTPADRLDPSLQTPATVAAAEQSECLRALVEETAELARTPMALLTYLTRESQWIVASVGSPWRRTSRQAAFCSWAVHNAEVMFVEDALEDERFRNNPFVQGEPHVRFYAGAPVALAPGMRVGTVCALDTRPRRAEAWLADGLSKLASRAAEHLGRCASLEF